MPQGTVESDQRLANSLVCCTYRIRFPYPFQWGRPRFNAGDAVAVIAASFVAIIEVCCGTLVLIYNPKFENI